MASSSFPEKSEGRAAFNSAVWDDMGGGAGFTGGAGWGTMGGFPGMGSKGVSGDEGGKG